MLLNVLRNKLPPLCSLVLQLPPTTLSLNLNCNDSPKQGTIVGLVALAVLVRRGPHDPCAKVALAFGNKIVLTADYVSIETTCASALPTRSRSSWEPMTLAQR